MFNNLVLLTPISVRQLQKSSDRPMRSGLTPYLKLLQNAGLNQLNYVTVDRVICVSRFCSQGSQGFRIL